MSVFNKTGDQRTEMQVTRQVLPVIMSSNNVSYQNENDNRLQDVEARHIMDDNFDKSVNQLI